MWTSAAILASYLKMQHQLHIRLGLICRRLKKKHGPLLHVTCVTGDSAYTTFCSLWTDDILDLFAEKTYRYYLERIAKLEGASQSKQGIETVKISHEPRWKHFLQFLYWWVFVNAIRTSYIGPWCLHLICPASEIWCPEIDFLLFSSTCIAAITAKTNLTIHDRLFKIRPLLSRLIKASLAGGILPEQRDMLWWKYDRFQRTCCRDSVSAEKPHKMGHAGLVLSSLQNRLLL